MKKGKEKKEQKKVKYLKPILTKHRKLKDITASTTQELGCTKSLI
jgi:hypothetical protein